MSVVFQLDRNFVFTALDCSFRARDNARPDVARSLLGLPGTPDQPQPLAAAGAADDHARPEPPIAHHHRQLSSLLDLLLHGLPSACRTALATDWKAWLAGATNAVCQWVTAAAAGAAVEPLSGRQVGLALHDRAERIVAAARLLEDLNRTAGAIQAVCASLFTGAVPAAAADAIGGGPSALHLATSPQAFVAACCPLTTGCAGVLAGELYTCTLNVTTLSSSSSRLNCRCVCNCMRRRRRTGWPCTVTPGSLFLFGQWVHCRFGV